MTLNQIQYFCAIARFENYRAASEHLHVSQPSLSRSMASLEEELGISLFEKKGRGVILTRAGSIFLSYAQQICQDCDNALEKMKEIAQGGGSIDIGYIFPLAGSYIPTHVRRFLAMEGNENVTFHLVQDHTPALIEKMQAGELDICFGGCVDKVDLDYFPLLHQELVIITAVDHPLAAQSSISFEEMMNYPVIGYDHHSWMGIHTKSLYRELDLNPNIAVECPDEYSIVSLVRENFGLALVPRTDLLIDMKGISIHPITGHDLAHQIYMIYHRNKTHLPAVERFIDYMKQQASPIDSLNLSKTLLKDIIHYD